VLLALRAGTRSAGDEVAGESAASDLVGSVQER
jgi:hypothetical protein